MVNFELRKGRQDKQRRRRLNAPPALSAGYQTFRSYSYSDQATNLFPLLSSRVNPSPVRVPAKQDNPLEGVRMAIGARFSLRRERIPTDHFPLSMATLGPSEGYRHLCGDPLCPKEQADTWLTWLTGSAFVDQRLYVTTGSARLIGSVVVPGQAVNSCFIRRGSYRVEHTKIREWCFCGQRPRISVPEIPYFSRVMVIVDKLCVVEHKRYLVDTMVGYRRYREW